MGQVGGETLGVGGLCDAVGMNKRHAANQPLLPRSFYGPSFQSSGHSLCYGCTIVCCSLSWNDSQRFDLSMIRCFYWLFRRRGYNQGIQWERSFNLKQSLATLPQYSRKWLRMPGAVMMLRLPPKRPAEPSQADGSIGLRFLRRVCDEFLIRLGTRPESL